MIEDDLDWIFIDITTAIIMANLETTEINLIKDSWLPVKKDSKTAGLILFKGLFTKFPEYLALFPQFGKLDLSIDQMSTNMRLVRHATKVIDTVTFVVDCIGNETKNDDLGAALLAMVRSHLKRSIGLDAFRNLGIVLIDFICTINHRFQGNLNKLRDNNTVADNKGHEEVGCSSDDDNISANANANAAAAATINNASNNNLNTVTSYNNNVTLTGNKFDTNAMVAAWTKLYSNILDLVKSEESALASAKFA